MLTRFLLITLIVIGLIETIQNLSAPKIEEVARDNGVYVIDRDYGGRLVDYILKYNKWEAHKAHVQIKEYCASACTLVLGIVDRNRICVSKDAVFGFHAAGYKDPKDGGNLMDSSGKRVLSESGTILMMDFYPPDIKKWIENNGGLGQNIIDLKGKELLSMVKECKK